MQRTLSDNIFWAVSSKALIILSASLILGYLIIDANMLFLMFLAVTLIGCYYFVNEHNFIYIIFLLPLEHLVIFETGVADLRLIQIVFALVLVSVACKKYIFHRKLRFIEKTKLDMPIALILAVYIISSVFSAYLKQNIREILQFVYLICLFKFFASVLDSNEKLEQTLKIYVSGILLVVINIFSQRIIGTALIPCVRIFTTGQVELSFGSVVGQNYFFVAPNVSYVATGALGYGRPGIALLSITAFFLSLGFFRKPNSASGIKMLWGGGAVLFLISLILTYSRAGIFATIIGTILLLFKKKRVLEFGLLSFMVLYVFALPTATHYRFLESFAVEEGSFKSHLTSWDTCINMFLEKPLVGFGPGSYVKIGDIYSKFWNNVSDPHSFIFLTMAELGLMGLLAMGWFTVSILRYGWQKFCKSKYLNGSHDINTEVFIVLISSFIMAATTPVFQTGYYWGFMGIAYAAATLTEKNEKTNEAI